MPQLTKDEAIALAQTDWWKTKSAEEICHFQLSQDKLCMDFSTFHQALEHALGRQVFKHELIDPERLWEELHERRPKASFQDILKLLPPEKVMLLKVD